MSTHSCTRGWEGCRRFEAHFRDFVIFVPHDRDAESERKGFVVGLKRGAAKQRAWRLGQTIALSLELVLGDPGPH